MEKLKGWKENTFEDRLCEIEQDRYYDGKNELPKVLIVVIALDNIIRDFTRTLVCRVKGHDPIDMGHGDANSGCIYIVCQRCGKTLTYRRLY